MVASRVNATFTATDMFGETRIAARRARSSISRRSAAPKPVVPTTARAPARPVAGGLERRDEAQVGRVSEAGDEATAHAAGGAGDDDVRHRDACPGGPTSTARTAWGPRPGAPRS